MLAWAALITVEGALSWVGFFPALRACRTAWSAVSAPTHRYIVVTMVAVITVVVLWFFVAQRAFDLDVTWPLEHQHSDRVAIVSFVILIPALLATVAMWLTSAQVHEGSKEPTPIVIVEYLDLRDRLQPLLWFSGTVIGLAVLATGTLRKAMLEGGYATEATYPSALVLSYGAVFTLLLVVSYVPAYLLVRHAGERIVAGVLKNKTDVVAWNEDRKKSSGLLSLDVGLAADLKNALVLLGPLAACLVSLALPGK